MKLIIKYFFLLIALSLIGTVIYQNLDYFMGRSPLTVHINIKDFNWAWTTPALENIVYIGVCFLAGLLLSSIIGLLEKLKLNKIIKTKKEKIKALEQKNDELKTELNVFKHDPYIKKGLEKKETAPQETEIDQASDQE